MSFKPYLELAKIRLNAMVLVTTAVGFVLGSPGPLNSAALGRLCWTILGTGLARGRRERAEPAFGDSPRRADAAHPPPTAAHRANLVAACSALRPRYVACRRRHPERAGQSAHGPAGAGEHRHLRVDIHAAENADFALHAGRRGLRRPAAHDGLDRGVGPHRPGAVLLGTILFLWQIPHFLALAWMLRDDYARAGFRMLPLIDPQGHLTCLTIMLYSLALLPLGMAVTFCGMAGYLFGAMSLVLGLGFFLLTLVLRRMKTPRNARRVFLASLVYLPLLMLFLVLDGRPHVNPSVPTIASPSSAANVGVGGGDDKSGTPVPIRRLRAQPTSAECVKRRCPNLAYGFAAALAASSRTKNIRCCHGSLSNWLDQLQPVGGKLLENLLLAHLVQRLDRHLGSSGAELAQGDPPGGLSACESP